MLVKYKMSEIKLPLTLEITSRGGYNTASKKLTGSIDPYSPCWAGSFMGNSGFQVIPCALCVGPVPELLHLARTKETRPSRCACLCHLPPQYPSASLMSSPSGVVSSSPSFSLCSLIPASSVIPSLAPCIPPSFSCDLLRLCLPHWHSYLFCLSSLSVFFVRLTIPHFSPAPGLCISCVLLAYPGPLILFLIPVLVQVCKVISAEEQTGVCSRKCWTIQGVGGAHSTTYNLERCLYFCLIHP